ncbi:MAG: glycosyltransferase, partial [Muribaculaceae bacterium]|nr:glycosyltransferase [Muribaculaceae bacterium]
MIKLAIVSPCYNEEAVLENSARRLDALFDRMVSDGLISPDSFVLFVNDGSRDATWEIISRLHRANPRFKGLNLARNVGHQHAIMAGMMTARHLADAVVTIDADLQDDLDAIPKMVKAFTEGYDVVYGVKVERTAD